MPDITMCSNDKCKLRLSCYRFMAIADRWQSYSKYEPTGDKCENMIEFKSKKRRK